MLVSMMETMVIEDKARSLALALEIFYSCHDNFWDEVSIFECGPRRRSALEMNMPVLHHNGTEFLHLKCSLQLEVLIVCDCCKSLWALGELRLATDWRLLQMAKH